MAKMRLANVVTKADVEEAHRLFNISTMNAIKSGVASGYETSSGQSELIMKIEDAIKRKVTIGNRISHQRLQEDLEAKYPNVRAIDMAIMNLIKKEELVQVEGSRFLLRKR
jgi:DNA replication licensing factor MCM5